MKLTKDFSLWEFKCSCGCTMPDEVLENIKKLSENLQTIRDSVDSPITITNAYRCESHNKSVGGAKKSQHLLGKAADMKAENIKPSKLSDYIESYIEQGCIDEGGVGRYNTFTHYDIRGTKARWNYEK